MNNGDLYEYAEKANVLIEKLDLPKNKALSVKIGQKEHIGLDKSITEDSAEERTALAHELGHCATGAFYSFYAPLVVRTKAERKALKWAVLHCVPKDQLICLIKEKYKTNEIAEYFGVTEELIKIAYTYYFEYGIAI